jgi:hypothetical protein
MNRKILPALLLFVTTYASAQQTLTNFGNLQVHPGTSITAFGNVVNNSTGVLINNGDLYIRGNIANDQASMATGAGTLYLNGTAAQALTGTQAFRTFRLVTNNALGITLNNNLRVADLHTFSNGIISTSATPNYLVYEAGSSYTGDADTRHVSGWVKKIGNTAFSFPVGNGTYLRKVALNNLSAASEFNVRHRTVTPNVTNIMPPLFQADPNEYWEINRVSGGFAQVAMNWDNTKIPFPDYVLSEIRAVYYSGGVWTDQGGTATGNVFTQGGITSFTVNTFGLFTMGSLGWTLPMRFISIGADRDQAVVLVNWQTAQEYNVDHFEIERSAGNEPFRQIGTVSALNTGNGSSYVYTDRLPAPGTASYRIKGMDKDGKVTYSAVVVIGPNTNTGSFLRVLNNPAKDAIFLSASADYNGLYGYELYSNAGQLVQKGTVTINGNSISQVTLSSKIIPGVYVLHVRNDEHRLTEKIVVK